MNEKRISQKELLQKIGVYSDAFSQSTLSKILSGKQTMTVNNLEIFSKALEVPINLFFEEEDKLFFLQNEVEGFWVETQKNANIFKGYLGTYNIYFFAPSQTERGQVLSGKLNLLSKDNVCCANLKIFIANDQQGGVTVGKSKEYFGQMIISKTMESAYIIVMNPQLGDLGTIVFRYRRFRSENLEIRLGLALTSSAGDFNLSTAHYVLISHKEISQEKIKVISNVFMRIGNDNCCISDTELDEFRDEFPETRLFFDQLKQTSQLYYSVDYYQLLNWVTQNCSKEIQLDVLSKILNFGYRGKYNEILSTEKERFLYESLKQRANSG